METEERIQQQMLETRASLTEKLETLEQKVLGTVEEATSAVSETVGVIKDTVQESVTSVNDTVKEGVETVKDFLDVPAHVDRHPWLMLGGSVTAGFVLGTLLERAKGPTMPPPSMMMSSSPNYRPPEMAPSHHTQKELGALATPTSTSSAPSSNWSPELGRLKSLAIGVLFGTAREMLVNAVPPQVGQQLKDVVDGVTRKLGGEPITSSDVNSMLETATSALGGTHHKQSDSGHAGSY